MRISTKVLVLSLSVSAVACATPVIMLKNEVTGQVARCGGDVSSSLAGGAMGYSIQRDNDEQCARDYEALGFKRLGNNEPTTAPRVRATDP